MMKWFPIIVVTTLLVFAFAVNGQPPPAELPDDPSLEDYNFDFTGGGARAEGMGKAFIAVSDDITAGSWNPAGLFEQEKPILSISYGSLVPRGATNANILDLTTSEFDHTGSFGNVTSLNFLAPIRIKGHHFVGSFNYTRNFDEFQSVGFFLPLREFIGTNIITFDSIFADFDAAMTTKLQGGLNSINLGVGTRLYENIAFGVSVNIYTGTAVSDQLTFLHTDSVQDLFNAEVTREAEITEQVLDTNKFSGYNFTIGFKLNGEKLDAGLVIRTPFSLNVKTGRSFYVITKLGAPGSRLLVSDELSDTTYFDNLLSKYKMPLMVGAGLAYRPNENSILAMDVEFRKFSGAKIKARDSLFIDPGGDDTEFFTEVDPDWNNVFIVRVGGEYLKETGIGVIPLRAGFGYVPSPIPNIAIDGSTSTTTSYSFSLGTGIQWNQIHFDWAYTYTSWDWEVADMLASVEQKNRNHHLNFTFTGYF